MKEESSCSDSPLAARSVWLEQYVIKVARSATRMIRILVRRGHPAATTATEALGTVLTRLPFLPALKIEVSIAYLLLRCLNIDEYSAAIKRESLEPLMSGDNGGASNYDATRQTSSSAVSTAVLSARNSTAMNTAETGAALSRKNDFAFRFPPPSQDVCGVPIV